MAILFLIITYALSARNCISRVHSNIVPSNNTWSPSITLIQKHLDGKKYLRKSLCVSTSSLTSSFTAEIKAYKIPTTSGCTTTLTDNVPIPLEYQSYLKDYIMGRAEFRDDEYSQDGRVGSLIARFKQGLIAK